METQTLGCATNLWGYGDLVRELGADPTPFLSRFQTRRIATKYLEAHYLPSTATLSERVATLAHRLLPTGQCSVDAIGDELAMHPRTLQRQLAIEGVRCQDLIDRERRSHATRYLADPRFHLSQIAVLLGYNEQSTFNRACRRWFGKTPREYRADLNLSGAASAIASAEC